MERKTLFIIGAVLLFGAVLAAVALAQNTDSQNAADNHECTPEMMKNMSSNNASEMAKNCTPEMIKSGNCKNMPDGAMAGCGSMMANTNNVTGNHMADPSHCSNMNSSMDSMMGTGKQKTMA
ncbi:MAG: hypothetical protein PHU34_00705 [Candidatus Methanoperedens sp.]|nr:hypothetical protein [Candidatus Methanoperedens sp.]